MENKEPDDTDRIYPCVDCGILRTEAEGGKIFTVCDECWEEKYSSQKYTIKE